MYSGGAPMRLYSTIRIEAAEQADGWPEWVAKYEARSDKVRSAVAEKTDRLLKEFTSEPVPTYWAGWTLREVREAAIDHYNERSRGDSWATADSGRDSSTASRLTFCGTAEPITNRRWRPRLDGSVYAICTGMSGAAPWTPSPPASPGSPASARPRRRHPADLRCGGSCTSIGRLRQSE